jgi:hypothetical protein
MIGFSDTVRPMPCSYCSANAASSLVVLAFGLPRAGEVGEDLVLCPLTPPYSWCLCARRWFGVGAPPGFPDCRSERDHPTRLLLESPCGQHCSAFG